MQSLSNKEPINSAIFLAYKAITMNNYENANVVQLHTINF